MKLTYREINALYNGDKGKNMYKVIRKIEEENGPIHKVRKCLWCGKELPEECWLCYPTDFETGADCIVNFFESRPDILLETLTE